MPGISEFYSLDATAMADLVRRKEVKPIELVDAALDRIERLNPTLNAVVTPMYEQARATAIRELPQGPFTGVPFLLKDVGVGGSYAGVRMTMGSAFLSQYIPDHDSELVVRLKRTGLIILGKTNTPEFGLLPTTEPHLFGPSRNPWDLGRTTGGSSGGAAVAVAAGFVPMAHANDGGGSIRTPSSCCGVFGLKPTRGRNPFGPDFGDLLSGMVSEHAVTRSVRDSAALLDATSGPDVGDPYWAPPPSRPFLKEVGANPGKLRIAFATASPTGVRVHADCISAVRDAAKLCATLGHEVEEATPTAPWDLVTQNFLVMWFSGVARTVESLKLLTGREPGPDQLEPLTWALYEMGKKQSASAYLLSLNILQRISRDIARFLLKYDVWLTPTLSEPPVVLGTFNSPPEDPLQAYRRVEQFVPFPFTPICNATGQPAMSVPLYWNADNLPIGVQFIGRFGDEATLFRLAAQLESARPWANRRPPVSA